MPCKTGDSTKRRKGKDKAKDTYKKYGKYSNKATRIRLANVARQQQKKKG